MTTRVFAIKAISLGLLGAGIVGLGACTSDFDSQMVLSGYRVIGIEASPPEVGPEDSLKLRVHEFLPIDEAGAAGSAREGAVAHAWSACLYSVGANEAYRCADPELEQPLGSQAEITLDLGPQGLNLRQRLESYPSLVNEDGSPRTFTKGFDIWIKLRSGPDCAGCESIDTVKRLTIRETTELPHNANPVVEAFEVVGAPVPGGTLTLRLEAGAPEVYRDPNSNEQKQEEYLYSWYTSKGKTDPTRTFGASQETKLTLPKESGPVELIATVRDGRGGLAVARQTIFVQ